MLLAFVVTHYLNHALGLVSLEALEAGRAAIVGEMGYGQAVSVTAVGDAVNIASRLEALTKELGAQLVVSDPVARHAGVDLEAFPLREIEVRGRAQPLAVRVVANALKLPIAADRAAERATDRVAAPAQ